LLNYLTTIKIKIMSKKIDLATTVNITSTYAGEFAGRYVSAALLSASTIEDGGVTVMPNIKYKSVIQRVETGSLIADGTCDFTASSNVDLTEVIIQPEEFQVNLQLCKSDFIDTWEAAQMGFSAFNPNGLPTSFADYLVGYVASKVAGANETNIWTGNLGGAQAGEYNGLETLAAADATVIDVPAPVALTSVNIIDKMQAVVDLIPNALFGKEDLRLYVSNKAAKLYIRALGGFTATIGAAGSDNRGTQWYNNGSLSFGGIPVFVARGMSDNTMIAAESSNLFFGTGLLNDYNEVRVIDMTPMDGSQNVRLVMRFTAAAAIGVGADVVYYAG
tara:strand:+ start:620 stop:1615 length:996 start_codon:yes stop_codon:yes gene_type:complete